MPKENGQRKNTMFSSKIPTGIPLPMIQIKLEKHPSIVGSKDWSDNP